MPTERVIMMLTERATVMPTEQVREMLMDIFNSSLESGQVPEDWRVANVTPLFKDQRRIGKLLV